MDIQIDTSKSRLQLDVIHRFLADSYWSKGIPLDVVRSAIESSVCFGAYDGSEQVGFARVVTDGATFAYLADVFVVESHRGRGLASRLLEAVMAHPQLQGLRRWILATRDAHGLYARHGFTPLAAPERFMERHDPEIYLHRKSIGKRHFQE